jgi:hypothetical protein
MPLIKKKRGKRMNHGKSITGLGMKLDRLMIHQAQLQVVLDGQGVIKALDGPGDARELYRGIRKASDRVLIDRQGKYSEYAREKLQQKFSFEVVCLDKDENGWMAAGIKTPVGIISIDL